MPTPPKILLIEDDDDLQMLVADILILAGYSVVKASNGLMGVELAMQEAPAMILCDMLMPEMNGLDVLRKLRQESVAWSIPFVFTSAKADFETIERARDAGVSGYLVKPFTRKELLDCVRSQIWIPVREVTPRAP